MTDQTDQTKETADASIAKSARPRWLLRVTRSVVIAVVSVASVPVILQNSMIYFPSRYDPGLTPGEGQLANFRKYTTTDGRTQWGYFVPPAPMPPDETPRNPRVWLVFSGNASSAMNEADTYDALARETGAGFFLVDYRGYGFNDGRPTEAGLVADALGAYDTLAAEGWFEGGAGVIGHSLGGGAAITVASQRPVRRLITLSTFTSIDDMAKRVVPWPIYLGCWNHWPNDDRLQEIVSRPPDRRPERITLLHGTADEVVPFAMGESLARICGSHAEFIPIKNGTHNEILDLTFRQMCGLVRE